MSMLQIRPVSPVRAGASAQVVSGPRAEEMHRLFKTAFPSESTSAQPSMAIQPTRMFTATDGTRYQISRGRGNDSFSIHPAGNETQKVSLSKDETRGLQLTYRTEDDYQAAKHALESLIRDTRSSGTPSATPFTSSPPRSESPPQASMTTLPASPSVAAPPTLSPAISVVSKPTLEHIVGATSPVGKALMTYTQQHNFPYCSEGASVTYQGKEYIVLATKVDGKNTLTVCLKAEAEAFVQKGGDRRGVKGLYVTSEECGNTLLLTDPAAKEIINRAGYCPVWETGYHIKH